MLLEVPPKSHTQSQTASAWTVGFFVEGRGERSPDHLLLLFERGVDEGDDDGHDLGRGAIRPGEGVEGLEASEGVQHADERLGISAWGESSGVFGEASEEDPEPLAVPVVACSDDGEDVGVEVGEGAWAARHQQRCRPALSCLPRR